MTYVTHRMKNLTLSAEQREDVCICPEDAERPHSAECDALAIKVDDIKDDAERAGWQEGYNEGYAFAQEDV